MFETFLGVPIGCNASPVLSPPHDLRLRVAPCLAGQVHLKIDF